MIGPSLPAVKDDCRVVDGILEAAGDAVLEAAVARYSWSAFAPASQQSDFVVPHSVRQMPLSAR